MIPGPQKHIDEKISEIAQLKNMSNELKAKLEQAQEEFTQLNNECLKIFIYEKPELAREFTEYFEGSSKIELEALIESQKILLAAFEPRKALAKEFSDRFSSKISEESSESLLKKRQSLLQMSELSKEKCTSENQDKLPIEKQSKKYRPGS